MSFAYASNVVTQELALQSKGLAQVRYFWCIICDLSRNISVVPNPQFLFNTELLTTSTFRDPLDISSLHPTWLSLTSGLASNPANREIASSSGASEHQDIFFFDFFQFFFSFIFSKNLKKYDFTRPKVSKYSLTS